jgi:predicted ABC-class ATPase
MEKLTRILRQVDGKSYRDYHSIKGQYAFRNFDLSILWVQGDPFAAPSLFSATIPSRAAKLPGVALTTQDRRVAAADFILRRLAAEARGASKVIGAGKGGIIQVDAPGQKILARSAAEVSSQGDVTLRFQVGLPADGRRIMGREAHGLITQTLNGVIERAVCNLNALVEPLTQFVCTYEDQLALRAQLSARRLVAFIPNGAMLPRRAGDNDLPLGATQTTPFIAPADLVVTLNTPNAGPIQGLGVREGITLICGGGYHGKTTLLDAIAHGIYNHIPGDGRERVVTVDRAVKVRAEDGRAVTGVDISSFIDNLPNDKPTATFTTRDASGSSSQAASVMESLELGATALLMDEDTCATNFMFRDSRMQALIPTETISPLLDHVRTMCRPTGPAGGVALSFVIAMGGSGAFLEVADHILSIHRYLPSDATAQGKAIAERYPSARSMVGQLPLPTPISRVPQPDSIDAAKGKRDAYASAPRLDELVIGRAAIDLRALEQLIDLSQTRAIGEAILWSLESELLNGRQTLRQIADTFDHHQREHGPVFGRPQPDLAAVRGIDIAAALNRLRTLQVRQRKTLTASPDSTSDVIIAADPNA